MLTMQQIGAPSSGSIRADTYSRNRYGGYVRNRSIPVNPKTPAQTTVRNRLRDLAQNWGTLGQQTRDSWANYAELHPRLNRLGETIVLSGAAQYIATNALRQAAGLAASSTVPGTPEGVFTGMTVVATIDTTGPTRVLTVSGINQPASNVAILSGSPPVSGGRVTPLRMTQFAVVSTTAWSTPVSIAASYYNVGPLFVAGQNLIIEAKLVDSTGNITAVIRTVTQVVDVTP